MTDTRSSRREDERYIKRAFRTRIFRHVLPVMVRMLRVLLPRVLDKFPAWEACHTTT